MQDVLQWIVANLVAVGGLATLAWTLIAYFATRRRELAWKRTEFLFAQAAYFDTDAQISEVVKIIDGRDPAHTVDQLYADGGTLDPKTRLDLLHKFDKLLNLFDRIAYAVLIAKTLSVAETPLLEGYLESAMSHASLVKYCEEGGFHDVVRLARVLNLHVAEASEVASAPA